MAYINLSQADFFYNPTQEQQAEDVQVQATIDRMANDPDLQAPPTAPADATAPQTTSTAPTNAAAPVQETVTVTESITPAFDTWKIIGIGIIGLLVWQFLSKSKAPMQRRKRRK